jgi:hypothetical protein
LRVNSPSKIVLPIPPPRSSAALLLPKEPNYQKDTLIGQNFEEMRLLTRKPRELRPWRR